MVSGALLHAAASTDGPASGAVGQAHASTFSISPSPPESNWRAASAISRSARARNSWNNRRTLRSRSVNPSGRTFTIWVWLSDDSALSPRPTIPGTLGIPIPGMAGQRLMRFSAGGALCLQCHPMVWARPQVGQIPNQGLIHPLSSFSPPLQTRGAPRLDRADQAPLGQKPWRDRERSTLRDRSFRSRKPSHRPARFRGQAAPTRTARPLTRSGESGKEAAGMRVRRKVKAWVAPGLGGWIPTPPAP